MRMARAWLIPFLLVLVFVGLRVARITADPPTHYPTGQAARELIVEGPAKAHEARRFGLFGTFATKPVDNYSIWRAQSPAYVLPLAGFFHVFGVSHVSLRIFAALAAGLGLVACFALGKQSQNPLVAPIACLLVAVSFFDIQLTRSGLIEPVLNGVLALAILAGILALRSLPWMLLCQIAFALALLTKQTALVAFPVLLAVGIAAHLQARKRGVPGWQHLASIGLGLLLGTLLLLYILSPRYWQTVEWNFGHMIVGVGKNHELSLDAVQFSPLWTRLTDLQRWKNIVLYIAPLAPLALIQLGRSAISALRRRPFDPLDLIAGGWLLCALVALQLTGHERPRFSIILLPPAALLIASFLASLTRLQVRPLLRFAPLILAGLVVVGTDLRWLWQWASAPRYEIHEAARTIREALDEEAVVVGSWASPLGFDSTADLFYVKPPFNSSKKAISELGVTHLLLRSRGDSVGSRVARFFPKSYETKVKLARVRIQRDHYVLYRLEEPLRPDVKARRRPASLRGRGAP